MSLKESNEITVKIKGELNEFYKIVEGKSFKIINKFSMDDTYFIPEKLDLDKMSTRDILSKAVLVRDIIGKIMVDLYKDELYMHFQGKELETIYENIFNKYEINMKKLLAYAKYRTSINDFIEFIYKLNIPKKYKLKR